MLIRNDRLTRIPNDDSDDGYIIETRTPPPKDIRYYSRVIARIVWEILSWGMIFVAFAFVYGFGTFNRVSGNSMNDTIHDGMYVAGVSRWFNPEHGDIVTVNPEQTGDLQLIKRVIAVGGDELRFEGSHVYLNGELLDEPYIREPMEPVDAISYIIPDDHVWVMGDNRNHSSDSRHFGTVSLDDVLSESIFHYRPPNIPFID